MAMAATMATHHEQYHQIVLAKNGMIDKNHHHPSGGSPVKKLENGWQEALITEYFENGGATIYIPRIINGWLDQEHHSIGSATKKNHHHLQQHQRGKVCVLSIDGGGMRGIIPAKLLAHLERLLQLKTGDSSARIVDFFDIVAGSNVGGMIGTMLFTGKGGSDSNRPLFSAEEAWSIIAHKGRSIFKRRIEELKAPSHPAPKRGFLRKLFSRRKKNPAAAAATSTVPGATPRGTAGCTGPKFSTDGLDAVLRDMLGDRTLRDTLKPVLVPCYDLATSAPFLFSRAGALESAAWDFRLSDVCRAASATPGLFPPAAVASVDGTTRCTAVDAGMVMNNPAAAAMTHVLHNGEEFPAVRDAGDVLLLSLGSGVFERRYDKGVADWGPCQWARPAAEIVLDNVSDMVDQMLAMAYASSAGRENYLRLQTVMPASGYPAESDDPSDSNIKRLASVADELLEQKAMEHMGFGGMRALQQTNAERLDWFAEQLIQEQRARALRSSPTVLLKKPKPH
ncbi:patatin-like protein 6 [Selaginella moellendorffii]|uniref:patatin-like protein 6 n=1 Tax=Selaginella moellendorffii TaxID=88036 RepID=UPI000D1C42AC|nr:patatin-like protein 6 [Selaginella moellendorffii]|eukprot:XP_024544163.1 patatin-like protein 6 [Selaginella moellendorffii]